ncbi:hypothetical protein A15I_00652 [Escherichia coli KTE204]|nr:hypothetical protein A15I_00652 [Escherichia coli KTE204]ELI61149.1 hypothetical protein WIQ_00915 [Escherichia coli KTE128]EOW39584.1 hypothetical protein A1YE_01574 [Escherichia coli KTE127]
MIKLSEKGVFLASNNEIIAEEHFTGEIKKEEAKKGTIAWSILSSHNTSGNMDKLKEGANKRGNSSRLTQSFHFFMFEPIFSPVNALNQPI